MYNQHVRHLATEKVLKDVETDHKSGHIGNCSDVNREVSPFCELPYIQDQLYKASVIGFVSDCWVYSLSNDAFSVLYLQPNCIFLCLISEINKHHMCNSQFKWDHHVFYICMCPRHSLPYRFFSEIQSHGGRAEGEGLRFSHDMLTFLSTHHFTLFSVSTHNILKTC